MTLQNTLEIIDREGWQKEFPINKSIFYIGSDPSCDLYLQDSRGMGISPFHAQVITPKDIPGIKLVNLGNMEISIEAESFQTIMPHQAATLSNGGTFRIGDFTFIYKEGDIRDSVQSWNTKHIGISLILPTLKLEPNRMITGAVRVANLGMENTIQVDLEFEGLNPGCYEIEPSPTLFPGAEKDVLFRIRHCGNLPPAGIHEISIKASAPRAYPGEEAFINQRIEVAPVYKQKLHLEPVPLMTPEITRVLGFFRKFLPSKEASDPDVNRVDPKQPDSFETFVGLPEENKESHPDQSEDEPPPSSTSFASLTSPQTSQEKVSSKAKDEMVSDEEITDLDDVEEIFSQLSKESNEERQKSKESRTEDQEILDNPFSLQQETEKWSGDQPLESPGSDKPVLKLKAKVISQELPLEEDNSEQSSSEDWWETPDEQEESNGDSLEEKG